MSCCFCYSFAIISDTLIYRNLSLMSVPVWSVMQTEEWKRAIQFQFCRKCLIFCDRKFWWRSQNMTHIPTWHTPIWLGAGWQAWKFNNLEKGSPSHSAWHKSLLWVSPRYVTYILQEQKRLGFLNYLHMDTNQLSVPLPLPFLFVSPTFTQTAQTWNGKAPVTSSTENRNSISCILMKMH